MATATKTRYHLQILQDDGGLMPFHSAVFAGINVRRRTVAYERAAGGGEESWTYPGCFVDLTDEQCQAFRDDVARHVVRWWRDDDGRGRRAELYHRERHYEPQDRDEPLARYVSMRAAGDGQGPEMFRPRVRQAGATSLEDELEAEARAAAEASEARARKDPRDTRVRARNRRARATGQPVEDVEPQA